MSTTIIDSHDAFQLTPYGLEIRRPLTWEEWSDTMEQLRTVKRAYIGALGDLTRHGLEQFGEERVSAAMEQMEFEWADASKASLVAQIGTDIRNRYELSSEHAFIIAKLVPDDPEQQEKWAKLACDNNLTAFELQHSINAGKIMRRSEIDEQAGHSAGIPTIQGVIFQFNKWVRSLGEEDDLTRKSREEREKILETLQPILDLGEKVKASLS